ncbi:diadenosine tetraphosphate (Ap4A) HIT family hydrolase [Hoeflea marina]|uniref:Diadenosine tetraphosphate (Ap4A) HIT family hydrolase n=1 Tax=Hoeflea marina TaxID=274592 RepID=A0A317PJ82_9HYPH|nr:HIT family protein [Hoeflea marina]PWW00384.1 diadenosine tetraphosphate (Ap4A) HIT family hydrolase [Hoeflea marina]
MADFTLHPQLEHDSRLVIKLGLCQLRLIDDSRWPWLILVPQRDGITEIFDMTPLDQTMLTFETGIAAKAMKESSGCLKINFGALGNNVRQFHLHVVGRSEGDHGWPGPVWGQGAAVPWHPDARATFIDRLLEAL